MSDCLFCKIAAGEIPSKMVHEDEHVVAFEDISPQAPVHVLVIPRKHLSSLDDAGEGDRELLGRLLEAARDIAAKLGITGAYRVVNNCGAAAGPAEVTAGSAASQKATPVRNTTSAGMFSPVVRTRT